MEDGRKRLADILPTYVAGAQDHVFVRGRDVRVTSEGRDSLITRIEGRSQQERLKRWKKLLIYGRSGSGRAPTGAVVLANLFHAKAAARNVLLAHPEIRPRPNGDFANGRKRRGSC